MRSRAGALCGAAELGRVFLWSLTNISRSFLGMVWVPEGLSLKLIWDPNTFITCCSSGKVSHAVKKVPATPYSLWGKTGHWPLGWGEQPLHPWGETDRVWGKQWQLVSRSQS